MEKRNVKTIIALLLVFILAMAMTGCADRKGEDSNSNARTSGQSGETSEAQRTDTDRDISDSNGEPKEGSTEQGKIVVPFCTSGGSAGCVRTTIGNGNSVPQHCQPHRILRKTGKAQSYIFPAQITLKQLQSMWQKVRMLISIE